MGRALGVIGTGTDIGKTYIAGLLVKRLHEAGYKVGYFKPAMSGNARDEAGQLIPGDAAYVKRISGISQDLDSMCPYVYEHAVAPHLAAQWEGHPMDLEVVKASYKALLDTYDYVIVEGAGGMLCPFRYDEQEIWLPDVFKRLGIPCVLIGHAGLGTLNGVGLTAYYAKGEGIPLVGTILNQYDEENPLAVDNRRMCEVIGHMPVLEIVADGATDLTVTAEDIVSWFGK